MTAPELMPSVQTVEHLGGQAARMTLDNGQAVQLSPSLTPRATLSPLTAGGHSVLLMDWRDSTALAYRVPPELLGEFDTIFPHTQGTP